MAAGACHKHNTSETLSNSIGFLLQFERNPNLLVRRRWALALGQCCRKDATRCVCSAELAAGLAQAAALGHGCHCMAAPAVVPCIGQALVSPGQCRTAPRVRQRHNRGPS